MGSPTHWVNLFVTPTEPGALDEDALTADLGERGIGWEEPRMGEFHMVAAEARNDPPGDYVCGGWTWGVEVDRIVDWARGRSAAPLVARVTVTVEDHEDEPDSRTYVFVEGAQDRHASLVTTMVPADLPDILRGARAALAQGGGLPRLDALRALVDALDPDGGR